MQKIIDYYTATFDEHARHEDGFGQLQRARTLGLLSEHLPDYPTTIADIGGATGPYAFALTEASHHVHLVDLVFDHITKAKQLSHASETPLAGCTVGDACAMPVQDAHFGAAILHGPLYHLVEKTDRLRSLREAYRILKPGGLLFAFGINRYAGLFYGIRTGRILDPTYYEMIATEVTTGVRERAPGWYFHLPDELTEEVVSAGFTITKTIGVASPAWMVPDLDTYLTNPASKQHLLQVAKLVEAEPIIGQDLLCIAKKAA